ncbi:MAG: hypothetical protein HQL81_13690 [Magnetococcales bacterium]|nr:hypothetical protein [Magnetococcales bacterium]
MSSAPPLYGETIVTAAMLLEALEACGERHTALRHRLADGVLRLTDHVVLALFDCDRLEHLHAADAELRTLRVHLLLALELRVLEEAFFLNLAERTDSMGRQIGGWIKKCERDELKR